MRCRRGFREIGVKQERGSLYRSRHCEKSWDSLLNLLFLSGGPLDMKSAVVAELADSPQQGLAGDLSGVTRAATQSYRPTRVDCRTS